MTNKKIRTNKKHIIGHMSLLDLAAIAHLSRNVPVNGIIVEVGSMMGKSTITWATNCHETVKVIAIDNFYDELAYIDVGTGTILETVNEKVKEMSYQYDISYDPPGNEISPLDNKVYRQFDIFLKNIEPYKNIYYIRGKSPQDINYDKGAIDLFFLDASHRNPSDWENICYYAQFIKKGGIISGHDWAPRDRWIDVNINIDKLEMIYNIKATRYENSVWSIDVTKEYDEVAHLFN